MTTVTLPLTLDELHDLASACTCALTLWSERSIETSKDPAISKYTQEYTDNQCQHFRDLRDRVYEVIDSLS